MTFVRPFHTAFLACALMATVGCKKSAQRDEPHPEPAKVFAGDILPSLEAQGAPQAGGVLRVAIEAEPASLNPQLDPVDYWGTKFGKLVYSSMAARDPKTWAYGPMLAESWDIAEDKKTFTFHLRKDVKWHDGAPFTAKDVLFTFTKLLEATTRSVSVRSHLEPLESFQQVDDHTVRFVMKQPYWFAFDAITQVLIYPEHIFKDGDFNTHPANRKPVGTGPFKFERWKAGEEISFAKNPLYFGDSAHLDRLVFRVVPEPAIRLKMLKRGDLDVVERLSPELWRQVAENPNIADAFWRLRHIPSSLQWVGWNMARPLFADGRVRRALTMLIDRRDIVENLRLGLDDIAVSWFYPGADEYNGSLKPLPYKPDAAKSLLKEAGWEDMDADGILNKDGKSFVFTFSYPAGNPFYEQLAGLMQADFKKVGIKVETARLEWAVFMERLRRHEFDACSLLWQLQPHNDPYSIWHSSAIHGGSNFVSFRHNEADKLLEQARVEFDAAKRNALYHRFSEILHEEQPYTMLFHRYNLSLVSKDFGGIYSTPYGILRYEYFFKKTPEGAANNPGTP